MPATERFLVTGALGCIGAWTVRELVREGTPVVAFDLAADPRRLRLIMSPAELDSVTFATGDIAEAVDDPGPARRAWDHPHRPSRRAPDPVLPGGPAARCAGQCRRDGQRLRGRAPSPRPGPRPRLRELDRRLRRGGRRHEDRLRLRRRRRSPDDPLRRLQAGQRRERPDLLAGGRAGERRPPPDDGVRRGSRPGPDECPDSGGRRGAPRPAVRDRVQRSEPVPVHRRRRALLRHGRAAAASTVRGSSTSVGRTPPSPTSSPRSRRRFRRRQVSSVSRATRCRSRI